MTSRIPGSSNGASSSVLLSPDQELFRDTAERFTRKEFPIERVREALGRPLGRDYLRQTGELGWYAPFVPEDFGGGSVSAEPVLDAVLLAEVLGRSLQPSPFAVSNCAADLIATCAHDEPKGMILPTLVDGTESATVAFVDRLHRWDRTSRLELAAQPEGAVLDGVVACVPGLVDARWIVLTADAPEGIAVVVVDRHTAGISIEPLEALDGTRGFAALTLRSVSVPHRHVRSISPAALTDRFGLAVILLAAESVGAMRQLFEMTVEYAKQRVAFGRTIGSFQAVKHLLADTSMHVELSSAIVHEAAAAHSASRADAAELTSVAKAYLSDALISTAQACLQVHGGIGYTWEHDLHLYLRRMTSDAHLLGDAAWHRDRLWAVAGPGEGGTE